MCGQDYPDFVEVDGAPSTFFERWIWPILGLWVVVVMSVWYGICEAADALCEGLACLREDTKHAWRSK